MEESVIKQINHIDHLIKKNVTRCFDFKKYLNMTQFQMVLYLLKHQDEDVCQKDLEAETHLKKASVTAAIDSLTEKGILIRKQAEDDRRKNYIKLTEESMKMEQEIEDRIDRLNEQIIGNISEQDLKTFYKVLNQLEENIRNNCHS